MGRQWYLDIARIVSMAAVVMIHTAAQYWHTFDVTSADWMACNVYDGMARWGVPVFVMISGALFLSPKKEQGLRKLYGKNILRIVTLILFWGFVYAITDRSYDLHIEADFREFFRRVLLGHYHMWFLYMIVGLYVATPLLRCITASRQTTLYFLILGFVLNLVLPLLQSAPIIAPLSAQLMIQLPLGYSFYYVLGYWLSTVRIPKAVSWGLYGAGVASVVLIAVLTARASVAAGSAVGTWYDNFSLPVAICAAAVFVAARQAFGSLEPSKKGGRAILFLSSCTLGIYMVHVLVLDTLQKTGFDTASFNPALAIPAVWAVTVTISLAITCLLRKIPFVNTYFV